MTTPTVVRIFFAIDLPADAKEQVGRFIGSLKKHSRSHAIRWTRADNLHVTLQFLPEILVEHVPILVKSVRAKLTEAALKLPILSIGKVQLFPNPYRPRVIVMEIVPQEHLEALAKMIGASIQEVNYPTESRPFKAHLTIGRIKYAEESTLSLLAEYATSAHIDAMTINEIILFRSDPQPEGSHYTPLEKINLS